MGLITDVQVNNYRANSGYQKIPEYELKVPYKQGDLRLHKVGYEYQIEYFHNNTFSHIVEGGLLDHHEAMLRVIEMGAKELEGVDCE